MKLAYKMYVVHPEYPEDTEIPAHAVKLYGDDSGLIYYGVLQYFQLEKWHDILDRDSWKN
jgi:hypothetical protein